MSTVQEIKAAIAGLQPNDRARLAAELFAEQSPADEAELEVSLQRGLDDVAAGRVHEVEAVRAMIPRWTAKS
jgi:predicted transcriptional regulator